MSRNEEREQKKADINSLQENFFKQQRKISALKELARKSEVAHGKSTSSAQEKVKNIAQRLSNLKSKARSRKNNELPSPQTSPPPPTTNQVSDDEKKYSESVNSSDQLADSPSLEMQEPEDNTDSTKASISSDPSTSGTHTSLIVQHAMAGNEKIQLMRQQMEENKLKMAQRASSKQHLEQLVTQLKEKFDSTQQCLEDTTELGRSMSDLSALAYTPVTRDRYKSATDLSNQPFSLERERIKFLENRCRLLEKQLEKEKLARKNSLNESSVAEASVKRIKELENKIVELEESAKNRADISVLNEMEIEIQRLKEELNAKENTISNFETTNSKNKQQELCEYENNELIEENERLQNEIQEKNKRIAELEEINDILETTRCELTVKNNAFEEQVQELQDSLKAAELKLIEVQKSLEYSESEPNYRNENNTDIINTSPSLDTDSQIKAEMAKQIQQQRNEIDQLQESNEKLKQRLEENEKLEISDATIAEKMKSLEATIEAQREDLQKRIDDCKHYEEELMEKTIELNVLNANFKVLEEKLKVTTKNKPLFSVTPEETAKQNPELMAEIQQLKQKLDEANKAMIKMKLKCKQTEKQLEKITKASDLHAEVAKLGREKEEIQQKLIELEDEKGQWQLQQVGSESETLAGRSELEEKLKVQTETIRLLEEQKFESTEKLETIQAELLEVKQKLNHKDMEEVVRVTAEMCELRLEEQLEEQTKKLVSLQTELLERDACIADLKTKLEELATEKNAVDKKLEHYINENMELLEKVEKLSKSSSSAESIEIVDRLTQQERAEIDEFNKRLERVEQIEGVHDESLHKIQTVARNETASELTQTADTDKGVQEINDSLLQLREESSELMNKIELFTTERREVLEKMEHLTMENQELTEKIESLQNEKEELETNALLANDAKCQLELKLQELNKEKELLENQVAETSAQKMKISQDLTSLQQSSEVVGVLEGVDGNTLFDKCEKSLSKLNSELEAYRKANDKNSKFNVSKKLAKEAKNAHTQLSELLQKVKEASTAVETVTVVETVVAVTAPNGKALAEYEQLTAQNRELKATIEELKRDLDEASCATADKREELNRADVNQQSSIVLSSIPELKSLENTKNELDNRLKEYEEQCKELQATVEDLNNQLQEERISNEEKSSEINRLSEEVQKLRKIADDLEQTLNDEEMSHEKQTEHMTRLRKELEAKCETYEGEMEVLQTLITEQKQQLIESYKENEHEINIKVLELQERNEEITQLRSQIDELKASAVKVTKELAEDLRQECEKLKETLKINKNLVAEQLIELANKQETIDALNQQIIDLYKSMEANANEIIGKEDEITSLQQQLDNNTHELNELRLENGKQKARADKLFDELNSNQTTFEQLMTLKHETDQLKKAKSELEATNKTMEQRNKDQLEKMKKYAANLKKKVIQCQEYEAKIKDLEKGMVEALESKEKDEQNELQRMRIENNDLSNKIKDLENMLREKDEDIRVSQIRINENNLNFREAIEKNEKLEEEIETLRFKLNQQSQAVEKLRNELAETQHQIVVEKNKKSVPEDILMMNEAIIKHLNQELAAKTASLENAEQALNEVQEELLKLQEAESERLIKEKEQKVELETKTKLIEDLRAQITISSNESNAAEQAEKRLQLLTEELKVKSLKFEKSKAVIKERNNQIHKLQAEIRDLQEKLSAQPEEEHIQVLDSSSESQTSSDALKEALEKMQSEYENLKEQYQTEKINFERTTARLETLHDGIQAKLQEDSVYIESLEQENAKYKEKICKLEECVGSLEERRASIERRACILDAQMQTREDEYERSEDALVYRLNALAEHDDVVGKRLLNTEQEKEQLEERLQQLQSDYQTLENEHSMLKKEHQSYRTEAIIPLEAENKALQGKLTAMEQEMQRTRSVYDARLAAKTTEIDELECELSDQLQLIHAEKRTLSEELERSRDECVGLKDEIVRLKETLNTLEQAKSELERECGWLHMSEENAQQDQYELQELRMQTMQDKNELDHLRHQIETLVANHEIELKALRTQISELDTLRMQVGQNQTDDQVFIEAENKRLTDLLAEKEAQIEVYQRQQLQMQMTSGTTVVASINSQTQQQPTNPFGMNVGLLTISPSPEERAVTEENETTARLQSDLNNLQLELSSLRETNNELKWQLAEKQQEIENMRMHRSGPLPPPPPTPPPRHQPSDVIPAPTFFASDQLLPSPFDDLVQARSVNNLGELQMATSMGHPNDVASEQPTIEDLQRNVSDLEKHAQDLEQKLLLRNQRDGELEERVRELQQKLIAAEHHVQERGELFQKMEQANEEHRLRQAEENDASQQQLIDLQEKLFEAERQLKERDAMLKEFQKGGEEERKLALKNQSFEHFTELQQKIEHLEQILRERDDQLKYLQSCLDEKKHLSNSADKSSQAQAPDIIDSALAAAAPTLEMFFGGSSAPDFEKFISQQEESSVPVQEEIIVPKNTYLCGPDRQQEALDINDDWGDTWGGSQEASVEEAHFALTESTSQKPLSLISNEQKLEIQIQEKEERIRELEQAQERLERQMQEHQQKSGKLMKKLKEYKLKIDELQSLNANSINFRKSSSVESNTGFDDLDVAIQEELRKQNLQLEAQLDEQRKLLENQMIEKEKLLKRVDVLTAGTERMTELKERQDMDTLMYQSRIRELQEKLSSLEEWSEAETKIVESEVVSKQQTGDDNTHQREKHLQQRIGELVAEIKEIHDDRQELQALLDEEKRNACDAEETVRNLRSQLQTLENTHKSKYNELKLEHQNLKERYFEIQQENSRLEEDMLKLKTEQDQKKSNSKLQELELKNEQLEKALQENERQMKEIRQQLFDLKQQNDKLLEENSLNLSARKEWEHQNELLKSENQQLQNSLITLQNDMSSLQAISPKHTEPSEKEESLRIRVDELVSQLQEKESEIMHLKQRIEDLVREDQTEKLVLEILSKNQEIHMLKMQVRRLEDDKRELENSLTVSNSNQLTDKQNEISEEKDLKNQEHVKDLENRIQELENEKRNMEAELEVLNNHVLKSLELEDKLKAMILELDTKNIEIVELRNTIEKLQTNTDVKVHPLEEPSVDVAALSAQWEAHTEEKCREIAQRWREHLEQREKSFKTTEMKLQEEIETLKVASNALMSSQKQSQHIVSAETTATSSASDESSTPSGSSSKIGTPLRRGNDQRDVANDESETEADVIIERMQAALESQEMEIVALKEQLAIRSAEYARLAAQYDPFKLQTTLSHSGMNTVTGSHSIEPASVRRQHTSSDDNSMVPKSELDLAMYMLHQRDMRCEEMTVELVSLLEERDTLQLKLSNTLRQVEAIKAQTNYVDAAAQPQTASIVNTSNDGGNQITTTGAKISGDPSEELNQKLSQLQTVDHSKDKLIKDERDQRIRQMERIQQDVAKMPSEALSELIGSDLSQTNQSPSSALLNWLWGSKSNSSGGASTS